MSKSLTPARPRVITPSPLPARAREHSRAGRRDDRLVDLGAPRSLEQQRDPQRVSLRDRHSSQDFAHDILEQIPQACEAELRLRSGRPRRHDAMPVRARRVDGDPPKRRLAHARIARQQHGRGPVAEPLHKRPERNLLVLPTHPGVLFATVQSGAVVRQVGCASRTYRTGETFVEHGDQPTGQVQNASTADPAVFSVTLIAPPGAPRREDSEPPSC